MEIISHFTFTQEELCQLKEVHYIKHLDINNIILKAITHTDKPLYRYFSHIKNVVKFKYKYQYVYVNNFKDKTSLTYQWHYDFIKDISYPVDNYLFVYSDNPKLKTRFKINNGITELEYNSIIKYNQTVLHKTPEEFKHCNDFRILIRIQDTDKKLYPIIRG